MSGALKLPKDAVKIATAALIVVPSVSLLRFWIMRAVYGERPVMGRELCPFVMGDVQNRVISRTFVHDR